MSTGPINYSNAVDWFGQNRDRAEMLLNRYFKASWGDEAKDVWHGQHFEWFVDRVARDSFTEVDLAAISALSVDLPAQTARELIEDRGGILRQLLSECNLWVALNGCDVSDPNLSSSWNERTSPFWRLWDELVRSSRIDLGPVKASKLMAAKFPALIPIFDSRVEWVLGLTKQDSWWSSMSALVQETKSVLDALVIDRHDIHVTTLRRLDVVLWMEAGVRQGRVNL